MAILQGLTVIIAALVALIGFLQWLAARQKAVFDLFDKRFKIYEVVKNCVVQVGIHPLRFDKELEREFRKAERSLFLVWR